MVGEGNGAGERFTLDDKALTGFRAREPVSGAEIVLVGKDEDSYLVERTVAPGLTRTEWRSGTWIGMALSEGWWVLDQGAGGAGMAANAM